MFVGEVRVCRLEGYVLGPTACRPTAAVSILGYANADQIISCENPQWFPGVHQYRITALKRSGKFGPLRSVCSEFYSLKINAVEVESLLVITAPTCDRTTDQTSFGSGFRRRKDVGVLVEFFQPAVGTLSFGMHAKIRCCGFNAARAITVTYVTRNIVITGTNHTRFSDVNDRAVATVFSKIPSLGIRVVARPSFQGNVQVAGGRRFPACRAGHEDLLDLVVHFFF